MSNSSLKSSNLERGSRSSSLWRCGINHNSKPDLSFTSFTPIAELSDLEQAGARLKPPVDRSATHPPLMPALTISSKIRQSDYYERRQKRKISRPEAIETKAASPCGPIGQRKPGHFGDGSGAQFFRVARSDLLPRRNLRDRARRGGCV